MTALLRPALRACGHGSLAAAALVSTVLSAGAATDRTQFDCILQPALSLKLSSPVASILDRVGVDRGDVVRKGQEVARLESSVEAAAVALDQVKADSTADIAAKQARLDLAKAEFDRQTSLVAHQSTSPQKFDEARANFHVAEQDLGLAQLGHRVAGLDLSRSRALLEERIIRSPVDGIVTQRSLGPGEFVSQEAHILTVAQVDPLFVETFLPIRYYGHVKSGDIAVVRPEEPVKGERRAVVSVVDQIFDAASGTFGIRLLLPNSDHSVPAGLRCHVAFDMPDLADASSTGFASLGGVPAQGARSP